MCESKPVLTLYTKSNCFQCEATKKYLNNHNTRYQEISLEEDELALAAAKDLGYRAAPVVFVRYPSGAESHWAGFNPGRLADFVASAKKWARDDLS